MYVEAQTDTGKLVRKGLPYRDTVEFRPAHCI
jgi:hypothetical protein